MSDEPRFSSVGWVFYGSTLLILTPPLVYLMFETTYEETSVGTIVGMALFLAGMVAAIFTWIVNSILGVIANKRMNREDVITDDDSDPHEN